MHQIMSVIWEISVVLLGVLVFTLFVLYPAKSCNYLVYSVFQASSLSCRSLLLFYCNSNMLIGFWLFTDHNVVFVVHALVCGMGHVYT